MKSLRWLKQVLFTTLFGFVAVLPMATAQIVVEPTQTVVESFYTLAGTGTSTGTRILMFTTQIYTINPYDGQKTLVYSQTVTVMVYVTDGTAVAQAEE